MYLPLNTLSHGLYKMESINLNQLPTILVVVEIQNFGMKRMTRKLLTLLTMSLKASKEERKALFFFN